MMQHAQTVHSDKVDLNDRMMRDLTSLHTALAASSHRSLPRLSPSQTTPAQAQQPSRSQPSTPVEPHPGASAGVVPSMAYDAWRRDDFRNEPFLAQSFPASQSFRAQPHLAVPGSFPVSAAYPDPRFPPSDVYPHAPGRPGVGRFLAPNSGHPDGPFQRPDPRGDGYDRPGLEGHDARERAVDDGGGNKPFTSGGSAGGGLPPISSLIPRAEQPQSLLPPAAPRPATSGGLAPWRPSSGSGRPLSSSGWLPPLSDGRPGLAHRPATAAAPLGFGSAASSRPGTSGGLGGFDRDRDVFAFEPPALAAPRHPRVEDDDASRDRHRDGGYRLPFGLRPGTAPAASFDRGGRGREWERERSRYRRDQSDERRPDRDDESGHESSSDRSRERYPQLGRRPARDEWHDERGRVAVSGLAASSPDGPSPDATMELGRRESGGLYPGDSDRDPGLLSPGGGGYDSPFSWHPPGLAPRKRSYDFGPGDATDGSDSRPASRRLTLMELCSTGPARDDDAAPLAPSLSSDGKPTTERGREPAPLVRPATVGGLGDSAGGLPGIASFSYGPGPIHDRIGALPARGALSTRGSSLPPPPSPPPTAMGERDDDGASARRVDNELFDRRDAADRFPGRGSAARNESDNVRRDAGAGVSDAAVRASTPAGHWRGEHERLRGQVRTPISPPPTATGVRAGSASN
ncbi:hypothetical protein FS749_000821 [Ceratobasidium sp. UAMH 11750]|nr:hypothetical protein FS749_000821 [Ceratobasidium sp. UAMH 11750]